ncbi:MAG: PAS domain S-box protein [Kofleriaceae bacterium]|nr:PAS domain S-box protein [Kofleriaceae bacterium]MBP9171950.1 PAS domain S-box protein [Kofleriaceae bacterium]
MAPDAGAAAVSYRLERVELDRVFPFHVVVGPDDCVRGAGPALTELVPDLLGARVDAWFRSRPDDTPVTFATLEAARDRRPLLDFAGRVALSGELIDVDGGLAFLGAPWVDERAELARLRAAEARHRLVLASAPDAIMCCDDGDRIVSANPAAEHLFGHPEGELRGRPITEFIPGFPDAPSHGVGRTRRFPCEVTIGESSDDGRRYHTLFIRDRTERDRAEAARRVGEQRYQVLVESLPEVVFEVDARGRLRFVNRAFETWTGFPVASVLGRDAAELIAPADRAAVRAARRAALSEVTRVRAALALPNQPPRQIELVLRTVGPDGGVTGIANDVTAKVEADTALVAARDAAQRAARAKSDFLAHMSHEIRTPMNAVIGMTSLLLDTPLDDGQREYVDTIRAGGEAMLALINEILDFSKIEAGHMTLEETRFDLIEVIESAMDLSALAAARKGLGFAYALGPDVPATVEGDATRLRQVLVNLLSNAVKFTHEGHVQLDVAVLVASPDEVTLEFAVTDTGIGIRPDRLDRLFHSFTQLDASTTRAYGGTGLGLAITKRLTELMGGGVACTSAPGRGSRFTAMVNLRQPSAPPDWRRPQTTLSDQLVACRMAPPQGRIVAELLQGWGAEVLATDDAPARPRSLVVTDAEDDALEAALLEAGPAAVLVVASSARRVHWEPQVAAALARGQRCLTAATPLRWGRLAAQLGAMIGASPSPTWTPPRRPAAVELDPTLAAVRILIAEDNLVNQRVAVALLQRLGCRADVVANGLEALDAVRRQPYDLVFLDLQMPEMDGLAAARAIGELRGVELPLLCAMTANATQADRDAVAAVGMAGFIGKPIDPAQLEHVVRLAAGRPRGEPTRPRRTSTAPQTPSAPPATISRRLDEIARDAGDDVANEIAELFLEDAVRLSARLAAATARGATDDARRAAHALRGAASNVGASHLASLAERCERAAGAADATALAAGTEALGLALPLALAALRAYLGRGAIAAAEP